MKKNFITDIGKTIHLWLCIGLLCICTSCAKEGTVVNTITNETPILDRALFMGNPEIVEGQLSPDGQWLSFLKEYKGIMNIWIKKLDEPFAKARPLTASTRPLYGYFWTYDSKHIIYVKDNAGDENLNIFSVDPFIHNDNTIPERKNLTPLKNVRAHIYILSKNNPNSMMIGLNLRDPAWYDLYHLDIKTAELTLMEENYYGISDYIFDWDDNLRIIVRGGEGGVTEFWHIDKNKNTSKIYEVGNTENASVVGWSEDNSKIYLSSNKGEIDLQTLYQIDLASLEINKIESDPKNRVDFHAVSFNQHTRNMRVTTYVDDTVQYYWKDKTWQDYYQFLQKKFPKRDITLSSTDKDYTKILVIVDGDRYAARVYLYDTKTKEVTYQYTIRPELAKIEQYLAPMKAISYNSSDGLRIPAYLTLPRNKGNKILPLVVYVHGGPKGVRDYWGYNPEVQFLANRGYAVLQANFRASGGYGKKFLNAGNLQWGKLMQDDLTWGVKQLIKDGIVDKNRVVIMGESYGGYATLAGLAFTPELYAAGVDIVGPSNLFTFMESIPAYWESGRGFLRRMVGDPQTEAGKAIMTAASPIFSVDKIDRPLLIIQGANDPRVKQAESEQIAKALYKKGKKVSYLLANDEGHGFIKPVNKMAMYAQIEKFLAEVLGGRYQQDMPEEVKKRLKELEVDVEKID